MALANIDKIKYLLGQIQESERIMYRNEVEREMFQSFPDKAKKLKKSGDIVIANIADQIEKGFENREKEGIAVDLQIQAALDNCNKLLEEFDEAEIEQAKEELQAE